MLPDEPVLERIALPDGQLVEVEDWIGRIAAVAKTLQHRLVDVLVDTRPYRAALLAGPFPQRPLEGFMQSAAAIFLADVQLVADCFLVQRQQRRDLPQLPQEGNVGRTMVGVAAADIGVHAGEPDLADHLILGRNRGSGPQHRLERLTAFIDRQGLEGMFDVAAKAGVVEPVGFCAGMPALQHPVPRHAKRTHRVPHADAADRHIDPTSGKTFVQRADVPLVPGQLSPAPSVHEATHFRRVQQPDRADKAGDAARGEGAAGEAEQEDLVARNIVVGQEGIDVADRRPRSDAHRAAQHVVQRIPGSDPWVIAHDLARAVLGLWLDAAEHPHHVRCGHAAISGIPCTVAADDQAAIRHDRLSLWISNITVFIWKPSDVKPDRSISGSALT
jgi:hypothetical protein